MEASWNVLEASWSVSKRLGALLQAIWPDTENVEKRLVFLDVLSLGRSWRPLGASWGVLERLRGVSKRLGAVLEPSWRRRGHVLERS